MRSLLISILLSVAAASAQLTASEGVIESSNTTRSWKIVPSEPFERIALSFISFSTSENQVFVSIYDGPSNASHLLLQASGKLIPTTFYSTQAIEIFVEETNNAASSEWTLYYRAFNGTRPLLAPAGILSDSENNYRIEPISIGLIGNIELQFVSPSNERRQFVIHNSTTAITDYSTVYQRTFAIGNKVSLGVKGTETNTKVAYVLQHESCGNQQIMRDNWGFVAAKNATAEFCYYMIILPENNLMKLEVAYLEPSTQLEVYDGSTISTTRLNLSKSGDVVFSSGNVVLIRARSPKNYGFVIFYTQGRCCYSNWEISQFKTVPNFSGLSPSQGVRNAFWSERLPGTTRAEIATFSNGEPLIVTEGAPNSFITHTFNYNKKKISVPADQLISLTGGESFAYISGKPECGSTQIWLEEENKLAFDSEWTNQPCYFLVGAYKIIMDFKLVKLSEGNEFIIYSSPYINNTNALRITGPVSYTSGFGLQTPESGALIYFPKRNRATDDFVMTFKYSRERPDEMAYPACAFRIEAQLDGEIAERDPYSPRCNYDTNWYHAVYLKLESSNLRSSDMLLAFSLAGNFTQLKLGEEIYVHNLALISRILADGSNSPSWTVKYRAANRNLR